ncbi:hypothetical protein PPL_07512 [Heterostelium album PN500]|uniref:DUF2383 domain-containing protein n=1 Tax=Heterostelium pallidum (strain ATCC 26659 / Pp 5 / PN500) TaxID=670386 RepID=D3BG61_HETP5|nr:hypothetical protein PPL_07512 [Heterostelium album PN500]EFA79653.1 hypothetical protein PPL_07512 [Heterostelium album PN500]|eukprot:XP_020431774.1 hypothetical protein PPL_07512 [Heterostelium album PN500]
MNKTLLSVLNSCSKQSFIKPVSIPKELKSYSILINKSNINNNKNKDKNVNTNNYLFVNNKNNNNIANYGKREMSMMYTKEKNTNNESFVSALQKLVECDYDAIESYKISIDHMSDERSKEVLEEYMLDHQRHIRDLTELLWQHGESVPSGPSSKRFLSRGKVVLDEMRGNDSAILSAMHSNEDDTNRAYERICNRSDLWQASRSILERGREEEIKHRKGIEDLKSLLKNKAQMNA